MTKAWCIIGADGYAGYAGLYQQGVTEAACMAHVRRKSHPRRDEIASDVGETQAELVRRAARAELLTGIEGVSSRPVRKIVLREG